MAKIVRYNGQEIPFADDATPAQMKMVMMKISQNPSEPSFSEKHPIMASVGKKLMSDSHPPLNPRDLLSGALRGGQKIASLLGEGGQAIASLATGGYAPTVDIREEMGMGKNHPVDVRDVISGKGGSKIAQTVGEYGIPGAFGGSSIMGQSLAQGMYGAAGAPPGEGLTTGLKDAGMTAALGTLLGKGVPYAYGKAKDLYKYLTPGRDAEKFISELAGVNPGEALPTREQNFKTLSQRAEFARKSSAEEALIPKSALLKSEGESRVIPSQKNPEQTLNKVQSVFAEHPKDITPESAGQLRDAMKVYFNGDKSNPENIIEPYDMEALIDKGEEIFNHPGLDEKGEDMLWDALQLDKPMKGKYLKIDNRADEYGRGLRSLDEAYAKNPTVRRADKLLSALKEEQRSIVNQPGGKRALNRDERKDLEEVNHRLNSLKKDFETFVDELPADKKDLYKSFTKKWVEGPAKFEAKPSLRMMGTGKAGELESGAIGRVFREPTPRVKMLLV